MPQRPTKGKQPRIQDVAATADDKLMRHIRALGLDSADSYRSWCRRHGFSDAVRKSWQDWRQERLAASKTAAEGAASAELRGHLAALGLDSIDAYRSWCHQHGFSDALHKNRQQRQQERLTAERLKGQAALAGARRHTRRPQETLQAISRGEVARDELKSPSLLRIHDRFAATAGMTDAREAFLWLLLHGEKHARLLTVDPVIRQFGMEPGNTFIDGLLALALDAESWIRPLEAWKPDTHNARRQFGSLARHLLARYEVPPFMDAAWFQEGPAKAQQQQGWFKHIGMGQNIRTADVPLHLTKMMAHHFLEAPGDYPIEAALRWGQIMGLGGDENLVRAVVSSRLGESFENEAFWVTVLHFFVNNPMLDTACVGPIVDYIHHQKFVPREIVAENGVVERGDPAAPEFCMKGRSATVLLRQVEAWHGQLAREARKPSNRWERSGIGEFRSLEAEKQAGNVVCWTIRELLSSEELRTEGKAMNHCVGSYDRSCVKGTISIWSMQIEDCQQKASRRVMTIAVQNKGRVINQARGKANAYPGVKDGGGRLRKAHTILRLWAKQEGLGLAKHL